MPRRARVAFANLPHHIVQRGHCRNDVFLDDFDRRDYLETLAECRETLCLKVYAYCLMTNHVHLIIDPGVDPSTISLLMKRLAGRHSRRLNLRNAWSGSLWESRFKCSPIDTDRYLLACGRYVDMNPVRAGMVSVPEAFQWSSFRARAGLISCGWLDADPAIGMLAETGARQHEIYRDLVGQAIGKDDIALIRSSLQRNQLTGSADFVGRVHAATGLLVPSRSRGRPRQLKSVR